MNRYAEVLYGQIKAIYEETMSFSNWKNIHSPEIYWIDVTNIECKVGDVIKFQEGVGLTIVTADTEEMTLEKLKEHKITLLKNDRNTEETKPIEYDFNIYDYDERARDRINAAIIALELQGADATIPWTTADDCNVELSAQDLKNIVGCVAQRSNLLHVKYRQLRDNVLSATSKEEVESVSWE